MAKHYKTSVISADSRQFYKETAIGTAKPTKEEMQGVTHYMIDSHQIEDEVNAARFVAEVEPILKDLFEKNDYVVLTGGSGMFIDALCYGIDDIPHSPELRNELNEVINNGGIDELLEELKVKDPIFYDQIDKNNPVRIVRAIEAIRLTGKPFSSLRKAERKKQPFQIHYFVLSHHRETLYNRINSRVDTMIQAGLIEEAKSLDHLKHLQSLNTVGYKELFAHFEGESTLEEAIDAIKQNTRRYAKRQLTWFRRNPDTVWLKWQEPKAMIHEIETCIQQKINSL